uniref:Gustatory receptor n=1 Tax=Anopheles dirus TaxID=7168 RepID=A0A182NQX2_9DIPT
MSHDVPITKAVFVFIKWSGQLFGILPLSFEAATFKRSRPRLWYCRMISLLLIVIYPCAYFVLLKNHNFPLLAVSYYLIVLQFTLNYIIVAILYLQVLFDPGALMRVLNELIENTNTLLQCTYSAMHNSCGIVGRRLLFKAIAIDLLQALTWYGTFIWLQRKIGPVYVLAFWLNSVAVMQLVAAINILLAALFWGSFLYRLINEHILTIIGNLLQMDDTPQLSSLAGSSASSERRFICNHIYRQLGVLRSHHSALTESIQNIVQFYNVPLGLIMLYQFLIIISEAEKTGVLLNEFLPTDPNVRVERCIESFTIELLHQDFKISNCGLYNVDYTLMFSMIATITSYLIMLVQFQLAEI